MTEQRRNRKLALKLVAGEQPQGPARKRRRLAAAIPAPEPARPRLPAQDDTAKVFDTEAWQDRWGGIRPVAEAVGVYVAGCAGTMALGTATRFPVFKVGTALDVSARLRQLNAERYGSLAIADFAVRDEAGWDDWEAAKLSARASHPASPVRVLARQLSVELPFWITPQDFEALLVAALEPVSLIGLAATPAGRDLARRRGMSTDALLRYTRGRRGPVLATEICAMAPSGDAARLVALIEWIVIRLVLADGGER